MTINAEITLNNEDATVTNPLSFLPALQVAFANWSNALAGNATIQVTVNIESNSFFGGTGALASCVPTFVPIGTAADGRSLYETDCAYQLITGNVDPNGSATDIVIYINGDDSFWLDPVIRRAARGSPRRGFRCFERRGNRETLRSNVARGHGDVCEQQRGLRPPRMQPPHLILEMKSPGVAAGALSTSKGAKGAPKDGYIS
jgi:hypothetical protein